MLLAVKGTNMLDWVSTPDAARRLFLPLFERHARVLLAGAVALRQMLDGGDRHCQAVLRHEEEADAITRDVLVGCKPRSLPP